MGQWYRSFGRKTRLAASYAIPSGVERREGGPASLFRGYAMTFHSNLFEWKVARREGLELAERLRLVVVAEMEGLVVVGLRPPAVSGETRRRYARGIQEGITGRRRNALT